MDKRCENCKYHDDYTAVCYCSESIFRADFTPNGYVCDKWEAHPEAGNDNQMR